MSSRSGHQHGKALAASDLTSIRQPWTADGAGNHSPMLPAALAGRSSSGKAGNAGQLRQTLPVSNAIRKKIYEDTLQSHPKGHSKSSGNLAKTTGRSVSRNSSRKAGLSQTTGRADKRAAAGGVSARSEPDPLLPSPQAQSDDQRRAKALRSAQIDGSMRAEVGSTLAFDAAPPRRGMSAHGAAAFGIEPPSVSDDELESVNSLRTPRGLSPEPKEPTAQRQQHIANGVLAGLRREEEEAAAAEAAGKGRAGRGRGAAEDDQSAAYGTAHSSPVGLEERMRQQRPRTLDERMPVDPYTQGLMREFEERNREMPVEELTDFDQGTGAPRLPALYAMHKQARPTETKFDCMMGQRGQQFPSGTGGVLPQLAGVKLGQQGSYVDGEDPETGGDYHQESKTGGGALDVLDGGGSRGGSRGGAPGPGRAAWQPGDAGGLGGTAASDDLGLGSTFGSHMSQASFGLSDVEGGEASMEHSEGLPPPHHRPFAGGMGLGLDGTDSMDLMPNGLPPDRAMYRQYGTRSHTLPVRVPDPEHVHSLRLGGPQMLYMLDPRNKRVSERLFATSRPSAEARYQFRLESQHNSKFKSNRPGPTRFRARALFKPYHFRFPVGSKADQLEENFIETGYTLQSRFETRPLLQHIRRFFPNLKLRPNMVKDRPGVNRGGALRKVKGQSTTDALLQQWPYMLDQDTGEPLHTYEEANDPVLTKQKRKAAAKENAKREKRLQKQKKKEELKKQKEKELRARLGVVNHKKPKLFQWGAEPEPSTSGRRWKRKLKARPDSWSKMSPEQRVKHTRSVQAEGALRIQCLVRGWRIRAELGELMGTALFLQYPYRQLFNFRAWRMAVMHACATRIARMMRYTWARVEARRQRAIEWQRLIYFSTMCERLTRGWFARLEFVRLKRIRDKRAATLIQSMARGRASRCLAADIQTTRWSDFDAMCNAACHMQRLWRGFQDRYMLAWWNYAATLFQRAYREHYKKRWLAALNIQRVWRGHVERMRVRTMCAMRIQRMARGHLARQWARRERRRLLRLEKDRVKEEERHVKVFGDVRADETKLYLETTRKGKEEIKSGAVMLRAEAKARASKRKESSWLAVLRDTFDLFDVERRQSLDIVQLGLLLQELSVSVTADELEAAVAIMDSDGNGRVEIEEFVQYFSGLDISAMTGDEVEAADRADEKRRKKAEMGRTGASTVSAEDRVGGKLRRVKFKLQSKSLLSSLFSSIYTQLATNAIMTRAKDAAMREARRHFRDEHPPPLACKTCVKTFVFERDYLSHVEGECDPSDLRP